MAMRPIIKGSTTQFGFTDDYPVLPKCQTLVMLKSRYNAIRRQRHNRMIGSSVVGSTPRLPSPTCLDRRTREFDTDNRHPLDPSADRSRLPTLDMGSWYTDPIFETREGTTLQACVGIDHTAGDVQNRNYPVSVSSVYDSMSPTIPLYGWSTSTATSSEATKFVSPSMTYDNSKHLFSHADSGALYHNEHPTSTTSSFDKDYQMPFSASSPNDWSIRVGLEGLSNVGINGTTYNKPWIIPAEPIASFSTTGIHSGIDDSSSLSSNLALRETSVLAHPVPSDLTIARHQEQRQDSVVSGKPSSSSSTALCSLLKDDEENCGYDQNKTKNLPVVSSPRLKCDGIFRTEREDCDHFLVQSRRSGLTYKEIRRRGGFVIKESTLRGRMRNISRPKQERLRKPPWSQKDTSLLYQAVLLHTCPIYHTSDEASYQPQQSPGQPLQAVNDSGTREKSKLNPPWKKMSEWMHANGASYPFSPATCAKKWKSLCHEGSNES